MLGHKNLSLTLLNSKPSSSKAEDSKPDISSTSSSSLPLSSSSHDTNSTIWINHHLNPNSNNPERNMADNQPSGEASQLLSSLQTITEKLNSTNFAVWRSPEAAYASQQPHLPS
ncbi:hypothetical protein PCASD_16797 [Puccinia coronata f. sp. avenae]|uniref:Uncharacterized protein n=1 Tax=Puccinia coronata f. sp. avenae TaxID=200324 RepID=A0A2N5TVJ8_9BASI|nr:hypothetical protein PCASD_16797 [Puccinia coronata f. sp. avenae]